MIIACQMLFDRILSDVTLIEHLAIRILLINKELQ